VTATVVWRHRESQKNISRDPNTLLFESPAHALYSNGPCAETKDTLPQYCCVAHALERAHRAIAQQGLEQVRHNIMLSTSVLHETLPSAIQTLQAIKLLR
jgi:hypothetical protein